MSNPNAFSPTLTAESSASRAHTDIDNLPELDIVMDGVPDINDLFNFDEYESANDSHSTITVSPNQTPSPRLAAHSPVAIQGSPSHGFSTEIDFSSFDFMNEKEADPFAYPMANADSIAGPSSFPTYPPIPIPQPDLVVKTEPVDIWADQPMIGTINLQPTVSPTSLPIAEASPFNYDGLPADQQAALQQLMLNMMAYQSKFGYDGGVANQTGDVGMAELPTTVEPSMLFSSSGSTSTQPAYSMPVPTASGSGSTSRSTPGLTTGGSTSSSLPSRSPLPTRPPPPPRHYEEDEEDALIAIEAHEHRSHRADSYPFSGQGDENLDSLSRLDRLAPLSSIFSAGKGKGGKKGGGMSSVVRGDDEDVDDDDSWRPSPEEYKKLSSKEKRQLRNKLSARAFRNRRKDYIGTLEGHIKERDGVIDEMKSELVNFRSENQDLRKELAALKASTMGILHPKSAVNSDTPAILQAFSLPPNITFPPPAPKRSAPTPVFNPRKDIGVDSKTRWGNENLFGGGSTICHTILTPDNAPAVLSPYDTPRANLNPLLSNSTTPQPQNANLQATADGMDIGHASFAEWSETNAWSIRSMDSYRMQMWGRLARSAASDKAGLSGPSRPRFLIDKCSDIPSSVNTHPSSPGCQEPTSAESAITSAVQITAKVAQSFWSAFQSPSIGVDTEKLTAVVTGKTRLKAMSIQPECEKKQQQAQDEMLVALSGLRLQAGKDAGWREVPAVLRVRDDPMRALGGLFGIGHGLTATV